MRRMCFATTRALALLRDFVLLCSAFAAADCAFAQQAADVAKPSVTTDKPRDLEARGLLVSRRGYLVVAPQYLAESLPQAPEQVVANDVTERNRAQRQIADMHQKLMDASRAAGMAEVATGVLHNVGNVLNSVNVSTNVLADSVRKSKAASIRKVADLLEANKGDLPAFFAVGGKGQMVPGYLATLAQQLDTEQEGRLAEIDQLAACRP